MRVPAARRSSSTASARNARTSSRNARSASLQFRSIVAFLFAAPAWRAFLRESQRAFAKIRRAEHGAHRVIAHLLAVRVGERGLVAALPPELGRASWRERVWQSV